MAVLEETDVPTMDTNEAVKAYMRHFSESCIHVGGLGIGQEEDDEVAELFADFGTVYGASVRVREQAHSSWALVSFASPAQAQSIINSEDPRLRRMSRHAVSHAQAMRSTGSLLMIYKLQLQKVQLRLQQDLIESEAMKLTRGRAQPGVLSKQDVQKLLSILDVEMSSTQLGLVMRQLGDGDGIVAELSSFHSWWAANGTDLTQAATAAYSMPQEVEDAIKGHPSGNPLRMLLLACVFITFSSRFSHIFSGFHHVFSRRREVAAGEMPEEAGAAGGLPPRSPGSPHRTRSRSHTTSDGSLLQTDEDTANAVGRMLRRLTPDEQHVLQLAAVCGADCSLRMIQTMQHELDASTAVASKHAIDDQNIVPTFQKLAEKSILTYPGSLAVMFDADGPVPHLLFSEKIVEEVVMASLVGESRHTFALAGAQRYLVTPELHREQLAKCFARTESGAMASARHLCSAALLASEMQADAEAATLCAEVVERPMVVEGEDGERNKVRWLTRLSAGKITPQSIKSTIALSCLRWIACDSSTAAHRQCPATDGLGDGACDRGIVDLWDGLTAGRGRRSDKCQPLATRRAGHATAAAGFEQAQTRSGREDTLQAPGAQGDAGRVCGCCGRQIEEDKGGEVRLA